MQQCLYSAETEPAYISTQALDNKKQNFTEKMTKQRIGEDRKRKQMNIIYREYNCVILVLTALARSDE